MGTYGWVWNQYNELKNPIFYKNNLTNVSAI